MQAGACLAAVVISEDDTSSDQPQQDAEVQHIGGGVYTVSATLERGGHYHIAVKLEVPQDSPTAGSTSVAPLQFEVVCMPAAAAAQCCRVQLPDEHWVAGRAAEVVVHQFDRQDPYSGVAESDLFVYDHRHVQHDKISHRLQHQSVGPHLVIGACSCCMGYV